MTKTIIHVWTQDPCNLTPTLTTHRWGIGDLLRGSYGLYLLSQQLNCEFIVDISLHPVSQLLEHTTHKYSHIIEENAKKILFIFPHDVDSFVYNNIQNVDVLYFCTNCMYEVLDYNVDTIAYNNFRKYMDTLFTPNREFIQYIIRQLSKIPFDTITILHYRLGDNDLVCGIKDDYSKYTITNIPENAILISDSKTFKECLSSKYNIFTFDENVCHLGLETEKDKIKHTLFEFILLTKADSIRSSSIYGGKSGFIRIIEKIYGIPCTYTPWNLRM